MSELIKRIGIELTRTEEVLRNNHLIHGFTNDHIKVEFSTETYKSLAHGRDKMIGSPETIFGFDFEVKENLKRDFIVYVDSLGLT